MLRGGLRDRLVLVTGAMEPWRDDTLETGDRVQPVLQEDPSESPVAAHWGGQQHEGAEGLSGREEEEVVTG